MKYIALMITVINDEVEIQQIVECDSYEEGIAKICEHMNWHKDNLEQKGIKVQHPNSWSGNERLIFDEDSVHKLYQWKIINKPTKSK